MGKKRRVRSEAKTASRASGMPWYVVGAVGGLVLVAVAAFLWNGGIDSASTDKMGRDNDAAGLSAIREGRVLVAYPPEGAVFPPDIAAPTISWRDTSDMTDTWRVQLEFDDGGSPISARVDQCAWTPPREVWEAIKQRSIEADVRLAVSGVERSSNETLSRGEVVFKASADEVGAPIFYREVNLPFAVAVQDPARHICWRFGDVSSEEKPPVVLSGLPICGNCHSFSADGSVVGLDVDYGSDKGSYALTEVSPSISLDHDDIITWADYQPEDNRRTLGLLSRVSPDGRYVVSTVKDSSIFAATDELEYSQLFFPIQGILAYYDRETGEFHALPGADDPEYVQSNAVWSPDGKTIVFARAKAHESVRERDGGLGLMKMSEIQEFNEGGKLFQYDLCRIPFNDGQGGKAEPLEGASNNGRSNYFAKYSPDGKWIVFCQANSFMLLQRDSALYIIPAEGGEARRLECNTNNMNSWHSWSPNGRWLVFSSKAHSLYTRLFLTHVDEQGRTTPPVVLSRFSSDRLAANIPEFVNIKTDALTKITPEFLDDEHYVQSGKYNAVDKEYKVAIKNFRKAIEINPANATAYAALGRALVESGDPVGAEAPLRKALALEREDDVSQLMLARSLLAQRRYEEGIELLHERLASNPNDATAHSTLGCVLGDLGRESEAQENFRKAAELDPSNPFPLYMLGTSLERTGDLEAAADALRSALDRKPEFSPAMSVLAKVMAAPNAPVELRDPEAAVRMAERACDMNGRSDVITLIHLSEVYLLVGRPDRARATAHAAMSIARGPDDLAAVNDLFQRLDVRP